MKEKILAVLRRRTQAIDYTPIYYFQVTRPIRSGTILRFDAAENHIAQDDEGYKGRDDIEE